MAVRHRRGRWARASPRRRVPTPSTNPALERPDDQSVQLTMPIPGTKTAISGTVSRQTSQHPVIGPGRSVLRAAHHRDDGASRACGCNPLGAGRPTSSFSERTVLVVGFESWTDFVALSAVIWGLAAVLYTVCLFAMAVWLPDEAHNCLLGVRGLFTKAMAAVTGGRR